MASLLLIAFATSVAAVQSAGLQNEIHLVFHDDVRLTLAANCKDASAVIETEIPNLQVNVPLIVPLKVCMKAVDVQKCTSQAEFVFGLAFSVGSKTARVQRTISSNSIVIPSDTLTYCISFSPRDIATALRAQNIKVAELATAKVFIVLSAPLESRTTPRSALTGSVAGAAFVIATTEYDRTSSIRGPVAVYRPPLSICDRINCLLTVGRLLVTPTCYSRTTDSDGLTTMEPANCAADAVATADVVFYDDLRSDQLVSYTDIRVSVEKVRTTIPPRTTQSTTLETTTSSAAGLSISSIYVAFIYSVYIAIVW